MRQRLTRFLFDSAYQVVTWVWIAASISAFFYFASKESGNGMRWSVASLVVSVVVMIALVASQHFIKPDGKERPERPELWRRSDVSISVQLLPAVQEEVGKEDQTSVTQVLIIFVNDTGAIKRDTHVTLRMPKIRQVRLDDPKRIELEGGGANATYVHLSVREMQLGEKRVATLEVEATKADTAQEWQQRYNYPDYVMVYRLRMGPEKSVR